VSKSCEIIGGVVFCHRRASAFTLFLLAHRGKPNFLMSKGSSSCIFVLTGQYTPKALNSIMENPKTNRYEAAKKLIEAAGGKLISMYSHSC